jgi:hypothetical protein
MKRIERNASIITLVVVLVLTLISFGVGSAAGYSNETLSGAWLLISNDKPNAYFIGNGSGGIIEHAMFNEDSPPGSYQVQSNGSLNVNFDIIQNNNHQTIITAGNLTSSTEGTLEGTGVFEGLTANIYKVTDLSVCVGTWTGTLTEYDTTGSNTYNITFIVNSNGAITSFSGLERGLEPPVSGNMFYESGYLVAYFKTGSYNPFNIHRDPYNQVRFHGSLSGNNITGTYDIDAGEGHGGTFLLTRSEGTTTADFNWVWVITDQRKYVDGTIIKQMLTDIGVVENGNTVSGADVSNSGKVSSISGELNNYGYWAGYHEFGKPWDVEALGLGLAQWMNETFDFVFHASDGDKHAFLTTTNEFAWLPFIDLKIVQGGKHPTFKWNKVTAADQYRVRIVNPAGSGMLIDDVINADGFDSYTYTYSGNLFSQYNKLTFRIEARDFDSATGKQLVNRSIIFYEHSAVKAMPWIPVLLGDD